MTDRYSRQRRYREKLRAEGLCRSCRRIYTQENPHTGKPFWHCRWCRIKASALYRLTGKKAYPTQGALDLFGESA